MESNDRPKLEEASLEELGSIIESYKQEFLAGEEHDLARKAEGVLKGAAEDAADIMIELARHATDDATRQRAAKYILDNTVFPSGRRAGGRDDFADLFAKIKNQEEETPAS